MKNALTFTIMITLLSSFSILSSPAQARIIWCTTKETPKINIKTAADDIKYDLTLPEANLNRLSVGSTNPYGENLITDTQGLMQGNVGVTQEMQYGILTNTRKKEVCYWIKQVDIKLHMSPTIYIAREFPQGSCKYNAIMAHEQKHVAVDRAVMNKYAAIYGAALQETLNKQYIFGPYPSEKEEDLKISVGDYLHQAIANQVKQMQQEREGLQKNVDTISEYESVEKQCQGK